MERRALKKIGERDGGRSMKRTKLRAGGFTLIAALMLMLLMSGLAIGLLMMVNTEQRAGGNDLENSLAYRGAEAGIEQMTSNIAQQFSAIQVPNAAAIAGLSVTQPVVPGITFTGYQIIPHTKTDAGGKQVLDTDYHLIAGGPNAGLYAQLIGVTLDVTGQRAGGAQVRMLRDVEVALIPVFQFGAFSESDLSLFNSPQLDFVGRVHTNGDIYLGVSNGANLTFHDKVTAYGNVIRMVYPNGLGVSNNDGNVRIPTASGGCDGAQTACKTMSINSSVYRWGSTTGGPNASQNTKKPDDWPTISNNYYKSQIMDGNYGNGNAGTTPVKVLSLPFVSGNTQPYEIIRRLPKFGQPATGADPSRMANLAQVRVLLGDNPADLQLIDGSGDAPVRLAGVAGDWAENGVNVAGVAGGNTYFAYENRDTSNTYKNPDGTVAHYDADFVQPLSVLPPYAPANKQLPLIDGYLLVEAKWAADGKWHGVTREWLQYGFARGLVPPASAYAGINPNSILVFQMLADRNGNANTTDNTATIKELGAGTVGGYDAQWDWYPINFYDAREGEARDWPLGGPIPAAGSCSVNGVMNAVELDVFNLKKWLAGTPPFDTGTGNLVDSQTQNGYILYFSDRRGMLPDPNAVPPAIQGEYGFEDVINNPQNNAATPDGDTEAKVTIRTAGGVGQYSPEDTNLNGRVDKYGGANVGDGFGLNTAGANPNPLTTRIANCYATGRKNRVTGARHVLKLTDGGWDGANNVSKLPMPGFTVASENPVYVQGDYNTYSGDGTWHKKADGTDDPIEPTPLTHAAAAVIADTVTLLSDNWLDTGYNNLPKPPYPSTTTVTGSLLHPFDANNYRPASTTYYRTAIAAGKTINFPHPNYSTSTQYFGTDGGLHNFLRFLEDWSGQNLFYKGSLVSLYYSTYDTGTFKCCNYMVYQPPVRNYKFDQLFADPANLPPGTPMFKDVNNLTYRQDFTPAY
jgi:hypothetical protein